MNQEIYQLIQSEVHEQHTYHMDALNFSEITKLVYGNSIEMLESPNDTTHEYSVKAGELSEDDQKTLNEAIQCGGLEDWNYDIILNDLCEKGYLKPGEYFLRMSW